MAHKLSRRSERYDPAVVYPDAYLRRSGVICASYSGRKKGVVRSLVDPLFIIAAYKNETPTSAS